MLQLKNGLLVVDIEQPEEVYLGSRFDQLGKIVQVSNSLGYQYLSRESMDPNTKLALGKGLFGEFGIDMPIGYDTCQIGDYFPKPGVGLLKKIAHTPFDFFYPYERIPFECSVQQVNDATILFTSVCSHSSYPFTYKKLVKLVDNLLVLDYTFVNLGANTIVTNEYLHNFLKFSLDIPNQSQPSLTFSEPINPTVFQSGLNPNSVVCFSSLSPNQLTISGIAPTDLFFNDLVPHNATPVSWRYSNDEAHFCSETVDFVPDKVNLWGAAHVVSPEIFKSITIQSGQTATWQRTFEFNSTTY